MVLIRQEVIMNHIFGHYIFAVWFLIFIFFFPCLISAVADWMSIILRHMMWP